MRPAVRATLSNLALLVAAVAPRSEAPRGWTDLGRRFDAFAEAADVVGGTAVLVRKGEIAARHHYGFADRAGKRNVSDRTIYHWASVSLGRARVLFAGGGRRIVGHTGDQAGYRSYVYLDPAASSGIILVFKTTNDSGVGQREMAELAREAVALLGRAGIGN